MEEEDRLESNGQSQGIRSHHEFKMTVDLRNQEVGT